ncbi:histidine kinase [Clostridium butyricum]|uniref:histidine kinase n=1 Tax=Clostridium butyricum TaxID=1492 RepID=UPI0021C31D39|nr:histidine kinase [Clostridium butyricum]MCQ2012272.1 histidine kinase [Clostridium butyricum]
MINDNFILYIFSTFIKTIFFSILIYKCTEILYLKKTFKLIVYFFSILLIGECIQLYINNDFFELILFHLFQLVVVFCVYDKKTLNPLIAFSFGYYLLCIYSNINLGINEYILSRYSIATFGKYNFLENIVILILIYLCMQKKDKIRDFIKTISEDKIITRLFIGGTFACDAFIGLFYCESSKVKNIKMILTFYIYIAMIILINYLVKVINKSYILDQLNKEMEIKNDELRKIKHDYGAQISYLYGLFLLQRWENLKEAIDKIVDMNESVSSGVIVDNLENSIIREAFEPILNKGIHVAIEENTYLNNINVDKEELLRIISEVGKALANLINEKGIILATTYISIDNIIIKVEGSGIIEEGALRDYSLIDGLRDKLVGINKSVIKNGGKMLFKYNHISTQIKISFPI